MGFDVARFIWQIVNILMLIGIIVFVFLVPVRIFKKINAIENYLEQINRKLEDLVANKKDTNKLEG